MTFTAVAFIGMGTVLAFGVTFLVLALRAKAPHTPDGGHPAPDNP